MSGRLFFPILNTEPSLRLGKEIFATGDTVSGTLFNDRIVVGPGVTSVDAGPGNDVITSFAYDTAGRILNGGIGDDLYLLGDGNGDGIVEDCLIFDFFSGGVKGTSDQIVLMGFSSDSQIVDLGEGIVEVFDTDGDVAILEVKYPDGSTVDGQTIIDSLVFPSQSGITYLGGGSGPLIVIAEDVEASTAAHPGFLKWAGRARSDTFLFDESIVQPFNAGGGDDVILADLSEATTDQSYRYFGGRGDDLIIAVPAAQTSVSGGAGDDTLGFITARIDWDGASSDIDLALSGGRGDDDLFAFIEGDWNLDGVFTVDLAMSGGAGNDTHTVTIDWGDGSSGVPETEIFISGGRGDDFIFVTESGSGSGSSAASPLVIADGLGADTVEVAVADGYWVLLEPLQVDDPDKITFDFRAATGGGAAINVGQGDLLTLRYGVDNPTEIEDCLIFDLTLGGVDAKPAELNLPDFGAETELTLIEGAIELVDPATGMAQTLNFESRDGTPLTPEQIEESIIIYGEGWNFGDIA